MNIFDFNLHLYSKLKGNLASQIKSDAELSSSDLLSEFNHVYTHFEKSGLTSGNFMLFNQDIIFDDGLSNFSSAVDQHMQESTINLLFDIRKYDPR